MQDFSLHRGLEYSSRVELESFQLRALRQTIGYLETHSPFYRERLSSCGVSSSSLRELGDLSFFPTTSKSDLEGDTSLFRCEGAGPFADYLSTSGTTSRPIIFALTGSDLERLAYNESRTYSLAGVCREDIVQLMTTMDRRFMAGLAYYLGARYSGLGVVRVGGDIPELQWETIRSVGSTVCMVVPSFLLRVIEYGLSNGIDPCGCTLRKAICIGESLYRAPGELNALGARIRALWPELELYTTYAATELQTAYTDCHCHCGGHEAPGLIYTEILDEEGRSLGAGEAGEVTVTTLGVKGMPLLRFRTGDIAVLYDEPCGCGRHSRRLGPILGRKSQMIKLKGTSLYPPAIFDVLNHFPELESYLVEVYSDGVGIDRVTVKVGVENPNAQLLARLRSSFRARLRVAPEIEYERIELIESRCRVPGERKERRLFDLRDRGRGESGDA